MTPYNSMGSKKMDEPRKAPAGDNAAKMEKPAVAFQPAEKGQPVSAFVTRLQPLPPSNDGKGASTLQELAFVKGLGKILGFYATLALQEGEGANKNLVYHGNVVINKDHHGIDVSTGTLQVPASFKDMSLFEIDLDRILVDFKEFAVVMDDFFDFLRLNVPSIVFLRNADAFLSKAFKVKDSSSASAFIVRFTQFIVNRVFQRDKVVLVIVTDNPRAMERRFLNTIDFTIDIDVPTKEERELYLKHLLSPESTADLALVASEMEAWTWGDIEAFAKHASLQKQIKGLKDISAKFLLDAIRGDNDLDRFARPSSKLNLPIASPRGDDPAPVAMVQQPARATNGIQTTIAAGIQPLADDPFKELLWESAADREYDAVARVLDHMEKGMFMQEDRMIIARYPFLLHDDILTAKRKLDAAKNKIDVIRKHFKGKST